jgi:uncharacterized HAD superfamily protein
MNKQIWLSQLKFNKTLFKDYGLDINSLSIAEKIKWAKEFYFHINKELIDLINCLPNWKMHYRNNENGDELISSNLNEEYIDVFKYFMGLGQVLGISFEDIVKGYKNKTEVVKQKYKQNKMINKLRETEVVLFDIDGVINNYPICFLDWVQKATRDSFSSIEELKSKLDLKAYEELKTKYRLSGAKRTQPVNEKTVELMTKLKKQGETIILFTNRPVTKYKKIYSDTLYWLKKNNIPFSAIFWSDYHQKEDIYKLQFKFKFIVEDNLDNAKNFCHEGYKVYLLNNKENSAIKYKNHCLIRVNSPLEIWRLECQE